MQKRNPVPFTMIDDLMASAEGKSVAQINREIAAELLMDAAAYVERIPLSEYPDASREAAIWRVEDALKMLKKGRPKHKPGRVQTSAPPQAEDAARRRP